MKILHLSAECHPAAKVGGLADVVGALPRYQREEGVEASVIMPCYQTPWLRDRAAAARTVCEGVIPAEEGRKTGLEGTERGEQVPARPFRVLQIEEPGLGFDLYAVELEGLFEGEGIYPGPGDPARGVPGEAGHFIAFQRAVLDWVWEERPGFNLLHCHDHHTALVPFMTSRCPRYGDLAQMPTVLTVHNAQYQGRYDWEKTALLPDFDPSDSGLLEWGDTLNSLAAGLKCCWHITTVSPTYLQELGRRSAGLERLFRIERDKSTGILNGIDTREWDPSADPHIHYNYDSGDLENGKERNKAFLLRQTGLPQADAGRVPLISFIGRLVGEKGADLLPDLFADLLDREVPVRFLLLGTGDPALHERFRAMSRWYGEQGSFSAVIDYNEALAHQIYAGSDFLLMPSRVEPCGLNQLYAMRYGTLPVVRSTGGLRDTVTDHSEEGGCGIVFEEFTLEAAAEALDRAVALYSEAGRMGELRRRVMKKDYSWNASAIAYIELYERMTGK
ncbi:MAG: glycogen/starch synthase [Balneolaceae bacterium]|nr:glycogen/starch synthase [Balneolaceae bacterium]